MADDGELAAIKQRLSEQQQRIDSLQASMQHQQTQLYQTLQGLGYSREEIAAGVEQLAEYGLSRRAAMVGMVAAAGGAGFLSGHARGAASTGDSQGDVGSPSNPFDGFVDGWALVTEEVSSATTVTKPVVLYDSALSGFTLTIDSSLEGPSGFSQPVWFLDQSGNADSNPVTVNDSGGSTIATIPAANSIFAPVWDGSEWLTDRYFPSITVDAVAFKEALDTQVVNSEGTSYNIDLEAGNYHKVTMTGDVDFDFTNVDSTDVNSVYLHLVQDGTGSRSPSFTTPTVHAADGSAPSWSTGANDEDIAVFVHDQDGSKWILAEGPFTLGAI